MWLKIILMLSAMPLMGMEQPLPVARLENYILISNNGNEIVLDGNVVREYLPGLAERFHKGMKEASGKIVIQDLDGNALANLQELINHYQRLKKDFDGRKAQAQQKVNKALDQLEKEKISAAAKQERKKEILEEYSSDLSYLDDSQVEQLSNKIQELPQIGEHFIPLFKELVGWQVSLEIEQAMAKFAAYNVGITQGYDLFKDIDPHAQLLYLAQADLSVNEIIKVLEWFIELENNPIANQMPNLELFGKIRTKIVDFIAQNIGAILVRYPDFKNILERPEFKNLSEPLRETIVKKNQQFFTKILRAAIPWPGGPGAMQEYVPFVSDLANQVIALHDRESKYNIYDFKNRTFKNSNVISQKLPLRSTYWNTFGTGYILWGSDRLIVYSGSNLYLYDINTGQRLFGSDLRIGNFIKIQTINNNQILVKNNNSELYLFGYDQERNTFRLINKSEKPIWDFVVLNDHEYLGMLVKQLDNTVYIFKYNVAQMKMTEEKYISIPEGSFLAGMRKINNDEVVIWITHGEADLPTQYLRIAIPDLNVISSYNIPLQIIGRLGESTEIVPMNSGYALIKEGRMGPRSFQFFLYNIKTETKIPLEKLKSVIVLDKNHIAAFDQQSNNFVIVFVSQTSTLDEILNEIQREMAHQPAQPVAVQLQKRAASPTLEERPIPAAAQGARTEVPEVKRKRPEKPNG